MLGRAYNEAEPEITLSCRFPAQMGIKYLLPLTMYGKVKKKNGSPCRKKRRGVEQRRETRSLSTVIFYTARINS